MLLVVTLLKDLQCQTMFILILFLLIILPTLNYILDGLREIILWNAYVFQKLTITF